MRYRHRHLERNDDEGELQLSNERRDTNTDIACILRSWRLRSIIWLGKGTEKLLVFIIVTDHIQFRDERNEIPGWCNQV